MPYILFIFGLLIGLFGLYRFMTNASGAQVKALFLAAFIIGIVIAVFFLAITGRLPAALGLMFALLPFAAAFLKVRRDLKNAPPTGETAPQAQRAPMSRREALEVFGLAEGAGPEEIDAAYKKLIKKVHPDQEGSAWLAAKLNQARDELLK